MGRKLRRWLPVRRTVPAQKTAKRCLLKSRREAKRGTHGRRKLGGIVAFHGNAVSWSCDYFGNHVRPLDERERGTRAALPAGARAIEGVHRGVQRAIAR